MNGSLIDEIRREGMCVCIDVIGITLRFYTPVFSISDIHAIAVNEFNASQSDLVKITQLYSQGVPEDYEKDIYEG
ncbi:MAG: hypothetical protein PF638_11130 [Candidatus Delongbacteria bacterium]|jgi:hypothetical protein|nr:hypothetical protein [Candidatus Delongbacteria bacterium]